MPDDINAELDAVEAKSSKLPIIIGAIVLLLAGLGGGAFIGKSMVDSGSDSEESGEASTDKNGKSEEATERGLFNLGLFTINLRGTGGGRVLRMEVQVETDASLVGTLEERKPEFRHAIITMVSDYSYSDLEGLDGKTRLADELLTRLNRLMDSGRINRLYFVQFVVQ